MELEKIEPFVRKRLLDLNTGEPFLAEGALLFMDISGFTELSEKLGQLGKPGTEELSGILNKFFGSMLNITGDLGGNVLKFGGDALLIGFYEHAGVAKKRAVQCARLLMDRIKEFYTIDTIAGESSISMKIDISSGKWNEILLGDNRRRELLLTGKVIKELTRMEEAARPGEVWVNGEKIQIEEISGLSKSSEKKHKHQRKIDGGLLPQGVMKFIRSGMKGEHRVVTTIFVNFSGYSEEDPDIELLQEFFIGVVDIVDRYGGSINKIDIYTKGSKLMITFGAPVAHEKETEKAILTALEISSLKDLPMRLKIGVCTGQVYAGIIGSEKEKTFTVIGDAVNTAARLMATAERNQPVISERTMKLVEDSFEFKELPPVKVKGKSQPLARYVPVVRKERDPYKHGFVGRKRELEKLVEKIKQGRYFIKIYGEPGIGKTRLLFEALKRLKPEYRVFLCRAEELKPAYYPFSHMIAKEAEIKEFEPVEVKGKKLEKYITEIDKTGELVKRIPFLGEMLFNIPYPGTIYDVVSAELRFTNLRDAIRYYMENLTQEKAVIVIENSQWLKEEDIGVINYISRILFTVSELKNGISLIVSGRPDGRVDSSIKIPEGAKRLDLKISPFTHKERELLLKELLKYKPLPADVEGILFRRAGGNPFYLEQFVYHLIEKGFIREGKNRWEKTKKYSEEGLPENVWSVIMGRIDRLDFLAKECLRVGSVIGLEFPEKMVCSIVNEKKARDSLKKTEKEGITFRRVKEEINYIFRHTLIKDVVYGSILESRKKELHLEVAKTIERLKNHEIEQYFDMLAIHYYQAGEWRKALQYNIRAGDKAGEEFRNEEAIKFYLTATEIITKHLPEKKSRLPELYERIGKINVLIGRHSEAIVYFDRMEETSGDNYLMMARSRFYKAGVYEHESKFDEAIQLLDESLEILKYETSEIVKKIEMAKIMALRCWIYSVMGEISKAEKEGSMALKLINESRRARDKNIQKDVDQALTHLLDSLGSIYYEKGEYKKAIEHYTSLLKISEKIGDKMATAMAYGNLGVIYYELGEYIKALNYYQKDLKLSKEMGDKRGIGISMGNIGTIYRELGEYEKAVECFEKDLKIAEELGDKFSVGTALNNLGLVYYDRGDFEKALEFFMKDYRVSRALGIKQGMGITSINIARTFLAMNEVEKAYQWSVKARSVFDELEDRFNLAVVNNLLCNLWIKKAELKDKREGFLDLLNIADEYARKAIEQSRGIGFKSGEAIGLINLGRIIHKKLQMEVYKMDEKNKVVERARNYFETGISLIEDLGKKKVLADTLLDYGRFLKYIGDENYKKVARKAEKIYKELNIKP